MKLYHFLGSILFALFLIATTAIFVIAGTFLESTSGSHRFAAHFTYSSPLFAALLFGFFINILVSALRRWPFQRRHIPFLITHTGLLMVLSGAMIKNYVGVQGTMRIAEGCGSSEILLPDTHAILAEAKHAIQAQFPLKQSLTGQWRLSNPKSELALTLTGYIPHAVERREIWRKDEDGRLQREMLDLDAGQILIVYDRGFGGYAVQVPLAKSPEENEKERLSLLELQLREGDPEQLSPPLKLLFHATQQTGFDFASNCIAFLDRWNQSKSWLFPEHGSLTPELKTALDKLDWNSIPSSERQGCLWIAALDHALQQRLKEGCDLLTLLQEHQWPFFSQLQEAKKTPAPCTPEETEQLLTLLTRQIFAVSDELPPLPLTEGSSARLYSAYLRAYSLHLKEIPYSPEIKTQEMPLTISYEASPPSKKLEDNRPVAILKAKLDGKTSYFSIGFDPSATGLKWPLFEGAFRVRFQPETKSIPYHIRLRQARQISYAGTRQPYAYESDLIIQSLHSGEILEKTISMNNVHETPDGYRFYLSSIAPPQEGALKQIQLVVNYDPAKYWLTYPGGIVLALGILLLFFVSQRGKNSKNH